MISNNYPKILRSTVAFYLKNWFGRTDLYFVLALLRDCRGTRHMQEEILDYILGSKDYSWIKLDS